MVDLVNLTKEVYKISKPKSLELFSKLESDFKEVVDIATAYLKIQVFN